MQLPAKYLQVVEEENLRYIQENLASGAPQAVVSGQALEYLKQVSPLFRHCTTMCNPKVRQITLQMHHFQEFPQFLTLS